MKNLQKQRKISVLVVTHFPTTTVLVLLYENNLSDFND